MVSGGGEFAGERDDGIDFSKGSAEGKGGEVGAGIGAARISDDQWAEVGRRKFPEMGIIPMLRINEFLADPIPSNFCGRGFFAVGDSSLGKKSPCDMISGSWKIRKC